MCDECGQQTVKWTDNGLLPAQFEGAARLDQADSLVLDVTRDDARKSAPEVGRKAVHRLVAMQVQTGHAVMGHRKRFLEVEIDMEEPVEEIGIASFAAEVQNPLEPGAHAGRR